MGRVTQLSLVLAMSLLWSGCGGSEPSVGTVNLATSPVPPLIKVSGDAMVNVVPDEVVFSIGVDTREKTIDAAKKRNDEVIKAMQEATKAHGIDTKDFQTDYVVLEPQYDPNPPQELVGAWARRQLTVTLRNVSEFDEVLTAVVEVGANTIYGIEFRSTELKKHRAHARELAVEAAREKAEAMVSVLRQKIGAAYSIREEPSSYWSSYYWGGAGRGQSQNVVQGQAPASLESEETLAPGQISISARVEVEFLLM